MSRKVLFKPTIDYTDIKTIVVLLELNGQDHLCLNNPIC
uniref:Uncharacterized protein n=1 Tax=Anguilla anguilla TaxID=7936 RepID=A0A0E9S0C8_ANGAN